MLFAGYWLLPWHAREYGPIELAVQVPDAAPNGETPVRTNRQRPRTDETLPDRGSPQPELVRVDETPQDARYPYLPYLLLAALITLSVLLWVRRDLWLPRLLPLWWRLRLGGVWATDDSVEFKKVLDGLHPVLHQVGVTPRGVKRCLNRIRLLALLQRVHEQTLFLDTLYDEMLKDDDYKSPEANVTELSDEAKLFWRRLYDLALPWPNDLNELVEKTQESAKGLPLPDLPEIVTRAKETAEADPLSEDLLVTLTTLHCADRNLVAGIQGKLAWNGKPAIEATLPLQGETYRVIVQALQNGTLQLELRGTGGHILTVEQDFTMSAQERFQNLIAKDYMPLRPPPAAL